MTTKLGLFVQSPNDEVISTQGIEPDFNLSDEQLLSLSQQWINEATPFHTELFRVQKTNEDYYLGNQTRKDRIPTTKSDAVQNHIFMGVETLVPVMTSNPAQFIVAPAQENEISETLANSHQTVLGHQYEARGVSRLLEDAARHMIIYRLGVLKVYWDEFIDDWNLKVVRPQRIWLPKFGTTEDELPFIAEKMDMSIEEIEQYFGKDKAEKIRKLGAGVEKTRGDEKQEIRIANTYTIWEFWTNDFVFWKCRNTIIGKSQNPYFDFKGRKKEAVDATGNAVVED